MSLDLVLLDDVGIKQGLGKNLEGLVLPFDTKLLSLLVNLDVVDLAVVIGLLGNNPLSEDVVGAVFAFVLSLENESFLEVVWQALGTCPDGFLGHINSPVILLEGGTVAVGRQLLSLSLDTTSKLVVRSTINTHVINLALRTAILGRAPVVLLALLTLAGRLGLLLFLGRILNDVARELMTEINIGALTASLAIPNDTTILVDDQVGFGVLALSAKNKLIDEAVEGILKLGSIMGSIDDVAIVRRVGSNLSTKLETEKLDNI